MDASLRSLVRRRADNRCEYCLLPQEYSRHTHQVLGMNDARRLDLRSGLPAHGNPT
jgi:hypothetical protein